MFSSQLLQVSLLNLIRSVGLDCFRDRLKAGICQTLHGYVNPAATL
jgi:hypothetical protein